MSTIECCVDFRLIDGEFFDCFVHGLVKLGTSHVSWSR
jgi:hypothetical protein